jgi:hypothetical protein
VLNYALHHVDVQTYIFLASAVVGGQWSASRPCCFTPGERAPGNLWIGGWVDRRAVWTICRNENFLLCQDSNANPSVVQPLASRYTDHTTAAFIVEESRIILFWCLSSIIHQFSNKISVATDPNNKCLMAKYCFV